MAAQVSSAKQRKEKVSGAPEVQPDRPKTIAVAEIKTHPTFVELLPVAEDLLEKMIRDMRANGYYESEPVVLGVWPGQEEPVLIDGHMRKRAAPAADITEVPFVTEEFPDEMSALRRAIDLQTTRRITTDAALYRLCEQFDRLMDKGRPRKGKETEELRSRDVHFRGPSASARKTASLIGCYYKKVDKIRKIRRDGTPEIREAVRNDKMTINKAYKAIRDMELGKDESKDKLSVARIKAVKSILSEEDFTSLKLLGGDPCSQVILAVKQFIRSQLDKERAGKDNGS